MHLLDLISRRIYKVFLQVMQFSRFAPPVGEKTEKDVGQYGLRLKRKPIRLPQLLCHCRILGETLCTHMTGGCRGGGRGTSISILPMERPHAYVRRRPATFYCSERLLGRDSSLSLTVTTCAGSMSIRVTGVRLLCVKKTCPPQQGLARASLNVS